VFISLTSSHLVSADLISSELSVRWSQPRRTRLYTQRAPAEAMWPGGPISPQENRSCNNLHSIDFARVRRDGALNVAFCLSFHRWKLRRLERHPIIVLAGEIMTPLVLPK